MQFATIGQANIIEFDVVSTLGVAIESGTVYGYLRAKTGTNAGKFWDGSAWQASKIKAGDMSHSVDQIWNLSIVSEAWEDDVQYAFYGVESGALNILYTETVVAFLKPALSIQSETTIS